MDRSWSSRLPRTSNDRYGAHLDPRWHKMSLINLPKKIRNQQLNSMRQKLVTSSLEYGFFYTNQRHLPPIPGAGRLPIPIESSSRGRRHSDQKASDIRLPDIKSKGNKSLDLDLLEYKGNDKYKNMSLNDAIKLPEVKQVDIMLHLKDDSLVTLRTIPKRDKSV